MTTADKYRIIELDTNPEQSTELSKAIQLLNGQFDADDFFVTTNDGNMQIWLRQIDLLLLSQTITDIALTTGPIPAVSQIVPAIEDIRSFGINGGKRVYVDYNKERKVSGRKQKERNRGKHYYAQGHNFHKAENELPAEFMNRILAGDSEEILDAIPNNSVDLIFTSPPYNFGLDYQYADESYDTDATSWENYFAKLFRILDKCVDVLKFGGRLVINVQPLFSDYIPSHHIISNYLMEKRMIWKGEILWEKNNYNCKYTAWGSWKSPSSPYLKYTWEFVEVFCKGDLKKKGQAENADIDADSFKQWVSAKWSIAPERRMAEFDHPAMFPEELAKRVLLLFSFQGDVILDPFAGAGTTCVVAKRTGRRYVGIDVTESYCETARERLKAVDSDGSEQGQFPWLTSSQPPRSRRSSKVTTRRSKA